MTWTQARRIAHAEAMRRWKPWERSTGPRTVQGKKRSSRNAVKPGLAAERNLMRALRLQRLYLKRFEQNFSQKRTIGARRLARVGDIVSSRLLEALTLFMRDTNSRMLQVLPALATAPPDVAPHFAPHLAMAA